MEKEMKLGIITILLAIILALISCLPAMAQTSGNITITMSGAMEFSINLTPANWSFGTVSPNTDNKTDLMQFNLTVNPTSNCNVNTFITADDAVCVYDSTYVWTLSSDGNNGERIYVLWFRVEEYPNTYIQITKEQTQFRSLSMTPTESVNFGLRLLTPQPDFGADPGYFSVGDATMQTHVTISAVAA